MIQVNVTVDYEGLLYHTNVITNYHVTQEKILQLALNQVKKQLMETEN
jgi:hypothetical protein